MSFRLFVIYVTCQLYHLRGLAIRDSNQPSGVTLLLEDYPYAADGLDVWTAIKTWVTNFCSHFYRSDEDIASDVELQSWWKEIREIGHGDKRDDVECWLPLNSLANLIQSLTTLIWIASALHAAVNFGQYGYAGFPPNRPTRCRKFIPQEGTTSSLPRIVMPLAWCIMARQHNLTHFFSMSVRNYVELT